MIIFMVKRTLGTSMFFHVYILFALGIKLIHFLKNAYLQSVYLTSNINEVKGLPRVYKLACIYTMICSNCCFFSGIGTEFESSFSLLCFFDSFIFDSFDSSCFNCSGSFTFSGSFLVPSSFN